LVNTAILEFTFPDGRKIHYQASRRNASGNMRAGPGILLTKKSDLLKVQGYNSNLETWGWEDDDILVRLQYALRLRRVQTGAALHLTHGDDRRALHGSGARSDRLNFLKCCRNYSNGLFLGTYCSDVAWAAHKVSETIPGVAAPEPRTIASSSQTSLSGPPDCGNGAAAPRQKPSGSDERPATIDELLLEANLKNSSLSNRNLLHVGIGNSRLATRLATSCRHITGVTMQETEQARAVGLGFENYRPVVCNKYSEEFRSHLPLDAYDVIADSGFVNDACCQRHWKALMQNYFELLAPAGSLVTARASVNCSSSGGWAPSEGDLVCLAGQFGMSVTKTAYGVYTLRKQHCL